MEHKPVLLNEVMEVLNPKAGEIFVDGTIDGGGHAKAILEKISPGGKLIGIDWDKNAIEKFELKITNHQSTIILVNDNFKNMKEILKNENIVKADGVLLDLGFSSEQLDPPAGGAGRGFSFLRDEPLLMTYSDRTRPAYRVLSEESESNLAKVIKDFGEERFAGRIARTIKKNLPVATSKKLAEVVASAVPKNYEHGRINPATRTFQALRIFVNQELENLRTFLESVPQILNPGGRLAVISFHSLEDRIVKNEFRQWKQNGFVEILTKKPITPSPEEIQNNPRSRSAKLRGLKVAQEKQIQ
ncbi:MAG: Ribosomal RNA small subunit methyltransferase H [Candidatus Jorgensenbacteria bacterium GW2011_GWA1_48_13]|uniref:Ribosomal RNA small subunit methyltransferase H n=2 Tax=Candidatus Joergenseniibacteriota TaxID=1752739 RepID=A0A0G1W8L5_9BACT|nr:MAG: Ribosomal RNA small subunit methyltransferase H [Candidatus Jorgensenbacteria bacterium GW2011_GWA1_48_13]KKU98647.1 MAG: S-adenosyl-methyltransferase MraW, S-adenosyl-methyltransferase [Candidatus Jorgensenbacteria bacterium GW2011_GWC1_48_8]KKW15121.1 MAG: Ribosomal RNA small subunit methyltransferase H [Candidatus Jorgensenbacteria bacterium GW2011_GWB1_50_10]